MQYQSNFKPKFHKPKKVTVPPATVKSYIAVALAGTLLAIIWSVVIGIGLDSLAGVR